MGRHMNEKQLTANQIGRINKLKQEAIEDIEKIPEGPNRRILDGGRSEFYFSIGEKLMADIKAAIEE